MTVIFLMFFSAASLLAGVGDIDITVPSSAPQGSTISCGVTVNVGSAAILGSYDVTFTFDPSVLQISEILEGTTSEFSDMPTFGDIATANTIGQIHIVAYQSSITSPTNLVSIFGIKFNVTGSPESSSTLSMIDTSLLNPNSGAISHQVDDKTFTTSYASIIYVNMNDDTCGGNSPCHTSIQAGIDASSTDSGIRIAKGFYSGSIILDVAKSLTLQGGWDSSFSTQTPNTTFIKAPKAPKGSLTLQMVTIRP